MQTCSADIAICGADVAPDIINDIMNGTTAYGTTAYGMTADGMTAYGITTYGITADGMTARGMTAHGMTAYGMNAYGMTAYGKTAYIWLRSGYGCIRFMFVMDTNLRRHKQHAMLASLAYHYSPIIIHHGWANKIFGWPPKIV